MIPVTGERGYVLTLRGCPVSRSPGRRSRPWVHHHIGDIRNSTNHATDEYSGFYTIMADTDPGERVKDISQAIDYFIHCYDRVCEMIAGKEANVVTIRTAELADYAKTIRDAKRHAKAGEGKKQ